jgi:hypothetical protein
VFVGITTATRLRRACGRRDRARTRASSGTPVGLARGVVLTALETFVDQPETLVLKAEHGLPV